MQVAAMPLSVIPKGRVFDVARGSVALRHPMGQVSIRVDEMAPVPRYFNLTGGTSGMVSTSLHPLGVTETGMAKFTTTGLMGLRKCRWNPSY